MKGTKISRNIGVLFAIMAVVLLESTKMECKISTIASIFAMIIIFSIFKGGIISGIGGAVISAAYIYYLRAVHSGNSEINSLSNIDFMLDIMAMLCIIIMAAIIHYEYRSYYEKFREADEYLSHAKEISEIMTCHSDLNGKFNKVSPRIICFR